MTDKVNIAASFDRLGPDGLRLAKEAFASMLIFVRERGLGEDRISVFACTYGSGDLGPVVGGIIGLPADVDTVRGEIESILTEHGGELVPGGLDTIYLLTLRGIDESGETNVDVFFIPE